jgi:hypothetical protein
MEALEIFFKHWSTRQFGRAIRSLYSQDFRPYKNADSIKDQWLKAVDPVNTGRITSSGSSGDRTIYEFGPIFGLMEIENLIKRTTRPTIRLMGGYCNTKVLERGAFCTEGYQFDYDDPQFSCIYDFSGNLFCTPNLLLFLSKCDEFIDLLAAGNIESIISTDWEPFFDEDAFWPYTVVNDNMCSWKNGHFFMTCAQRKRHGLPFSINDGNKSANLLNMADKTFYDNDDIIELANEPCSCGLQWPVVKRFESHIFNPLRPNMELRKELKGQYRNFQIIRNHEGKHEFFVKGTGGLHPDDKKLIDSLYNPVSLHVNFRAKVGQKYPNFWTFSKPFERSRFPYQAAHSDFPPGQGACPKCLCIHV